MTVQNGAFEVGIPLAAPLPEAVALHWTFTSHAGDRNQGIAPFTWSRFQGRIDFFDGQWRTPFIILWPITWGAPGSFRIPVDGDGHFDALVPAGFRCDPAAGDSPALRSAIVVGSGCRQHHRGHASGIGRGTPLTRLLKRQIRKDAPAHANGRQSLCEAHGSIVMHKVVVRHDGERHINIEMGNLLEDRQRACSRIKRRL